MIKLTAFGKENFDSLIQWIDTAGLLMTIAGPLWIFPLTKPQLEKYLSDNNSHPFNIVDENNKVIGHVEIASSGQGMFKIDKLIIGDQSNRCKGIGQQVINKCLLYTFTKLQAQTVELNVFDWNIDGIRCYENCGFVINPSKTTSLPVNGKDCRVFNMVINKNAWQQKL